MALKVTYKSASKVDWQTNNVTETGFPGIEAVNAGSLQRIAGATEIIAGNYVKVLDELARVRKNYESLQMLYQDERKKAAVLRGVITRHQNTILKLKQK